MSTTMGSGAGDVMWSLGFLLRYSWVILLLSAIPAVQRILAAWHPDDARAYAWPIETLIAILRLVTVAVIFWLGWRADTLARRAEIGSGGGILPALGAYVRQEWARLLVAVLIAIIAFVVLNLLCGPALASLVRLFSDDPRVVEAWSFGVRNLLIIPVFSVVAYGIIRPAFVVSGT
jgi:hypothetical protein